MIRFNKILAIGAHPDDVEYGCMGFLLKVGNDAEKVIYISSLGSAGDVTTGELRAEESKKALSVVNPRNIIIRYKAGITYNDYEEIGKELYSIISTFQPDLILTHSKNDTHQEHSILSNIVITSARRSRSSILFFNLLSNTPDFNAEIFVDISDFLEKKKEALRKHLSQRDKYYMSDEYLDIFHSNRYAVLHNIRYSEVFEIYRIFI